MGMGTIPGIKSQPLENLAAGRVGASIFASRYLR